MSKWTAALCVSLMMCGAAFARQSGSVPQQPAMATVPRPDVQSLVARIDQTAQSAAMDLARMRIEKWKTDRDMKQQSQANSDSVSRNLMSALPALTAAVRNSPQDFAANFKLYRNLNALYDVMKSLTESAGAFGPKEDFQTIGQVTNSIDEYRRALGDYLENLSAAKDQELARLRGGSRPGQSATGKSKKIIIDDNAPVKKKKKKPVASH
jgi:hypothetical protein